MWSHVDYSVRLVKQTLKKTMQFKTSTVHSSNVTFVNKILANTIQASARLAFALKGQDKFI